MIASRWRCPIINTFSGPTGRGGASRNLRCSALKPAGSRCRITLLGVLPEYRGKGIDAVLYHWIWTRGGTLGYSWGEAGWILEDNPAMNAGLVKMGFTVYKTYRLLDRPI